MTGDAPAAIAPHLWLWIVLALGLIIAALAYVWRARQKAGETEVERRPGQPARDSANAKPDRDKAGNGLDLEALEVSDIMIHRTAMRGVNADDPPEVAVQPG